MLSPPDEEPRVHRVKTDRETMLEAQMGLDDLLRRGAAIRSREARERAAKTLEEETDAIRQRRIKAAALLAARFEWKPVASVAIFEVQTCSHCGGVHHAFRGYATRMERKADQIKRLAAAGCLDKGLPFEMEELASSVTACITCITEQSTPAEPTPYHFIPSKRADE